jgi:hypothetical protein
MRRFLSTVTAALLLGGVFASAPAVATPVPVFTESFEACTDPSGSPDYTEYETATQAAEPIRVNLWINERINCPGWTAAGQAWMTTYSSGGLFPDGSHAAWLNEGPTEGSITRDITGLTPGRDYSLILETWTDDQDQATSLILEVTNGSDVTTLTYKLRRGQGIQALSKNFSAIGDTVTIKLIGSPDTYASPLVDNIRIIDAGDTAENAANAEAEAEAEAEAALLASTGFDAFALAGFAGALLLAGGVAKSLRRRSARN